MRRELGSVLAIVFVAAVATAACGQKDNGSANATADTTAAAAQPATTTPEAAPAAAPAGPVTVPPNLPAGVTAAMIQEGSQIFHGQEAGGTCYTCHGPDAKGTALAPDLTTKPHLWVTDYASYVDLIPKGVPTPKKHPAPMPPMGGAQLTPDQVKAVAAYEWSLSNPQGGK